MDQLELIRPGKTNEAAAKEYLEEHIRNGETALQGCGGLAAAKSYDEWLAKIQNGQNGGICFAQYFAVRRKDERLIGVINIRHP